MEGVGIGDCVGGGLASFFVGHGEGAETDADVLDFVFGGVVGWS